MKVKEWANRNGRFLFYCPGCREHHQFQTKGRTRWEFNGDAEKPTVKPSILTWVGEKDGRKQEVCHLFITDGKIRFLNDCHHELAGKTVNMVDVKR